MNVIENMAHEIKNIVLSAIQEGINEGRKNSNPSVNESETYYSRKEAADYLKISLVTLDKSIKEGLVDSYRLLGSIRLKKSELDSMLMNRNSLKFRKESLKFKSSKITIENI